MYKNKQAQTTDYGIRSIEISVNTMPVEVLKSKFFLTANRRKFFCKQSDEGFFHKTNYPLGETNANKLSQSGHFAG